MLYTIDATVTQTRDDDDQTNGSAPALPRFILEADDAPAAADLARLLLFRATGDLLDVCDDVEAIAHLSIRERVTGALRLEIDIDLRPQVSP